MKSWLPGWVLIMSHGATVPTGTVIFGGFAPGGTAPVGSQVDALGRPVNAHGALIDVATLSGGGTGEILSVNSADAIIDGITFTNANASYGGAIYEGSHLIYFFLVIISAIILQVSIAVLSLPSR